MNCRYAVLGLGAVAVDDLLYVDTYPPSEGKVRVKHRLRQCGGLTGTALVAVARLGARAAYAGVIGEDALSREILAGFRAEGVDVAHAVQRNDAQPAHSTIIVDESNKTRTIFSSTGGLLGADDQQPAPEVIRAASVLLVDHHGVPGTLRAVRLARDAGIGVVADFERPTGPPFSQLLDEVDHLIVSERFAQQVTALRSGADAAQALWSDTRATVVITCGSAGGWYCDTATADAPQPYPAFDVPVADTTGCGDVFHGAYAVALAEGRSLRERLVWAAAAAALKATRRGGQAGIPTRSHVVDFLKNRRFR